MIKRISVLSLILVFLLAACAPAEVALEEPAVMQESGEEAVMEESAMEESAEDTSMEASDDGSAMAADEMAAEVSFQNDVWPIIEEYALSAHGGNGGIFLENYDDIVAQVVPGDPENSMLYKVLIGDGAPQMPPGNPLPDELIQTIYDWIAQGALNN